MKLSVALFLLQMFAHVAVILSSVLFLPSFFLSASSKTISGLLEFDSKTEAVEVLTVLNHYQIRIPSRLRETLPLVCPRRFKPFQDGKMAVFLITNSVQDLCELKSSCSFVFLFFFHVPHVPFLNKNLLRL